MMDRGERQDAADRALRAAALRRLLVCRSEAMQRFFDELWPLIDSTVILLLRGESGVGKSWLARAIHEASLRGRAGGFVKLNTPRADSEPAQAEIFGVAANAYTGSGKARPGLIERADRGTLFFEELGRSPHRFQGKLLTVITDKELMRLGGTAPTPVDVRWIGATHQDLEAMVEAGEFEPALLRRFSRELWIPPLRERREDIPLLVERLAERFGVEVEEGVVEVLQAYRWPGNMHELAGVIEGANGVGVLTVDEALRATGREPGPAPISEPPADEGMEADEEEGVSRAREVLKEMGEASTSAVAERLDVHRNTARKWLKALVDAGEAFSLGEGRSHRYVYAGSGPELIAH